jgi:hypothetical protein
MIFFTSHNIFSQKDKFKDWQPNETHYYKNLEKLAEYVGDKPYAYFEISKDSLIQNFLYINEESKDSIFNNTVYSIEYKNGLFNTYFTKAIHRHGLENLDAQPLRFYKETDSIYQPFIKSLRNISHLIMVYYLKGSSEKPLGTLLFEPKSQKLRRIGLVLFIKLF